MPSLFCIKPLEINAYPYDLFIYAMGRVVVGG